MNEYNDNDIQILQQTISQTQEEYDQWSLGISQAKDYGLNIGDIAAEKYKDIDKIRELIYTKDTSLIDILDQKAALLQDIQRKNNNFLDNLDVKYQEQNKQYQEKIEQLHAELSQLNNTN